MLNSQIDIASVYIMWINIFLNKYYQKLENVFKHINNKKFKISIFLKCFFTENNST